MGPHQISISVTYIPAPVPHLPHNIETHHRNIQTHQCKAITQDNQLLLPICFWKLTTCCFVKYCTTEHMFSTHFCLIGQTLSIRFVPDLTISLSCVKPATSTNATFQSELIIRTVTSFYLPHQLYCLSRFALHTVHIVTFVNCV